MTDPVCGMDVSEKKALNITHQGKTYYFCSPHCLNKFAQQNQIELLNVDSNFSTKTNWYKNKIFITAGVLVLLCALSYFFSFLIPFRETLLSYFKKVWWAMLLGLSIGGAMDYYVPREHISFILARKKKRTIFYAVGLGFFMSVCSHGILAISIELYKKGASVPSVIAFLLSSPWANLPLMFMLIGFFGFIKAMYIVLTAIIIAIITGFIYQWLEHRDYVEHNTHSVPLKEDFSFFKDIREKFKNYRFSSEQINKDIKGIISGAIALGNMVLWWILLGMGLASLAGAYIPAHIFHQYMGPTFLGMVVTLAVATVIEVCSEGTSPLAFEIFRQTGALGNSLVFLMAGVATDYTEIGLLWQNVGKKTALWLPIITVPQVLFFGFLANLFF